MPTSKGQGPKYGGKQVGTLMRLCLAQVLCLPFCKDQKCAQYHHLGTGGTVAGTGHYLKLMNPEVTIIISDPDGSGLYNKVCWRAEP